MHRLRTLVLACACLFSAAALASPAAPKNGAEFTTLATPQPVQATGKKIEVIEFFMYHCPACYAIESDLNDWVKKQGDNIVFRRMHMPRTGPNDPEAHLFLTLEAMGAEHAMRDKVLHAWHVEHRRLMNDDDNIDWAVRSGMDKTKFLGFYNSFAVTAKLRNLSKTLSDYQVDSTPSLIVDGRYLTTPSMVMQSNAGVPRDKLGDALLQTLDALVAKAAKEHQH